MAETEEKETAPLTEREINDNNNNDNDKMEIFTNESIDKLTQGFLNILQPEVLQVEQSLNELTSNQEEMLISINTKRTQFEDTNQQSTDIQTLLQQIPLYKQKLITIQKNMSLIDKKMKKLQLRADKLKELRVTRDNNSKRELEKRMREEKLLEAKPSK